MYIIKENGDGQKANRTKKTPENVENEKIFKKAEKIFQKGIDKIKFMW